MDIDSPTAEQHVSTINNPFAVPPLPQPPMPSLPEEPMLPHPPRSQVIQSDNPFNVPPLTWPPITSLPEESMLSDPPQSQINRSDNPFIVPPLIAPPTAHGQISQTTSDIMPIQPVSSGTMGASHLDNSQRTKSKSRQSKQKISASHNRELEEQGFSLEESTRKSW